MSNSLSILPYYGNGVGISPAPSGAATEPSVDNYGPTFADIMKRLNQPLGGTQNFQSGIDTLKPTQGLDPAYQKMLDQIRSNASFYGDRAGQAASALAAKRGITGSSTEQFGVQTALDNTNRTAADQEAQVYMSNLQRQQAMQDATAKAYLDRSGLEGTASANANMTGANLTSDEIASLRNMALGQQSLTLQQQLGQQGIDIANKNIDASKSIAQQNGMYGLAGSLLPGLLFGGGGGGAGGGGFLSSLFGGGGAGAAGAAGAGGFMPYAAGGLAGPYAYGAGGAGGAAGAGGMAAFLAAHPALAIAGGGLASMGISKWELPKLQNALGTTLGSTAGFLLNPIGSQLNFAKKALTSGGNAVSNVGKSVSNAVSSVFPF